MFLAVVLITIITIIFAIFSRLLKQPICPICVGVSGTWLVLTAGIIWGFLSVNYKLPVAMLMGGTVVGIAFQGEKVWPWAQRSIFYWKVPAIVLGMPLAYFLFIQMSPAILLAEAVLLLAATCLFFVGPRSFKTHKDSEGVRKIEEKMKNCC